MGILLFLVCCAAGCARGGAAAGDCCGTNGDDGGVSMLWRASKRSLPLSWLESVDDNSDGVGAVEGSNDEELLDIVVNLPRWSLGLECKSPLLDVASVLYSAAALLLCWSADLLLLL
jgi:hypothetical protein